MENNTLIKEKLHQYIEVAEDEKLHAIFLLLEHEIERQYTSVEVDEWTSRRERHLSGESASYTVEESLKLVRKQKVDVV